MKLAAIPGPLVNLLFRAEPGDEALFWHNWAWMVPQRYRVAAYTAFGDWILGDVDSDQWIVLDLLEGACRRLPSTLQEFLRDAAASAEMRDEWLLEGLVEGMRRRGVLLGPHQVYEFAVHPVLEAPMDCSNIVVERLELNQVKLSSLFRR